MLDIKTRYLVHNCGIYAAAKAFAEDLMAGDPATFKAGYTAPNAALTAQEVFGLTDALKKELLAELEGNGS